MDTTNQTTNQTATTCQGTSRVVPLRTFEEMDDDFDDFDLIDFGIASNGGRLSMKR